MTPPNWRGLTLIVALLGAFPAAAGEDPGALELAPRHHAFLAGDEFRWRQHELVPKGPLHLFLGLARNVAADLLAIPADVTNWSAQGFAGLLALSGGVVAFMAGPVPLDAQVQFEVQRIFGHRDTRFMVWTQLGDGLIFGALGAASLGLLLKGWFGGQPELVEMVMLMVEAFCVAELFHLGFKLLLGREGPKDGEGLGVIWGPSRALSLFPAGTPSGHASSAYALLGAAASYWNNPWLTAGLQLFGLVFCTTMLIDDYHFVSDLVWGAAMGWAIGEWTVRHRSSRFSTMGGLPVRLVPVAEIKTGTVAVLLSASF